MEKENAINQLATRMQDSICEYDNIQYQLFERIRAMSIDDLEKLSCKSVVCYNRNSSCILELCVPVHLPAIQFALSTGAVKTYAELFKFYLDVWNLVFTKAFFKEWASGILTDFRSISNPIIVTKVSSPGIYLSDRHIKLLVMSLVAHKIIDQANCSFVYDFEYEQIEESIGHTVIEIYRRIPESVSNVSAVALARDDFALIGM